MHDPNVRPLRDGWHGPLEVLVDEDALARRISELGRQIRADYVGRELLMVGVLRGSFLFFADLARAVDLPLTCEFIGISSYGDAQASSGRVAVTQALTGEVADKDVLLVEDIVDTGLSLSFLRDHLAASGAGWVATCALLTKPARRRVQVPVEYAGFTIPDLFVVGFGLDCRGRLRNLPFVGVVPPGAP